MDSEQGGEEGGGMEGGAMEGGAMVRGGMQGGGMEGGAMEGGAMVETILVADHGNGRVSEFMLDGTFVRCMGSIGSGDGQLHNPNDVTVLAGTGEVAVADGQNHQIAVFDSEGGFIRSFGGHGAIQDGQFSMPGAIASDAHGNLLVIDSGTNRLQVLP
jgi:DNA-binding beta-propeller fold protein YncE